jgi:alanine-alpha-ketoisovalerate/valine-pyruvate aminotransferase
MCSSWRWCCWQNVYANMYVLIYFQLYNVCLTSDISLCKVCLLVIVVNEYSIQINDSNINLVTNSQKIMFQLLYVFLSHFSEALILNDFQFDNYNTTVVFQNNHVTLGL